MKLKMARAKKNAQSRIGCRSPRWLLVGPVEFASRVFSSSSETSSVLRSGSLASSDDTESAEDCKFPGSRSNLASASRMLRDMAVEVLVNLTRSSKKKGH